MSVESAPALRPFFAAWFALVGAVMGSFANVVVARVPAGESVVRPRSRCPACRKPIAWYDNVPVASWVVLRGRCRACGVCISPRYPVVEALGAAAGVVAFARHGVSATAGAELLFAVTLLALALIDVDTWLLPHALTWPLLAAGLLLSAIGITAARAFGPSVAGAAIGFAALALVAWVGQKLLRKEALGFGDVWLMSALGAWMGIAALLPVLLLASLQGAIVGVALILLGKAQPGPAPTRRPSGPAEPPAGDAAAAPRGDAGVTADEHDWVPPRHAVPFGPFLVAGALEWLWLGELIARVAPPLALFR